MAVVSGLRQGRLGQQVGQILKPFQEGVGGNLASQLITPGAGPGLAIQPAQRVEVSGQLGQFPLAVADLPDRVAPALAAAVVAMSAAPDPVHSATPPRLRRPGSLGNHPGLEGRASPDGQESYPPPTHTSTSMAKPRADATRVAGRVNRGPLPNPDWRGIRVGGGIGRFGIVLRQSASQGCGQSTTRGSTDPLGGSAPEARSGSFAASERRSSANLAFLGLLKVGPFLIVED